MGDREYGLWAVCIGLVVLGAMDTVVLMLFHRDAQQALALIGAVDSPVAVMVSAYFGMKIGTDAGSAGTAAAERGREQANAQALAFAAHMPPEVAAPILRDLRAAGMPDGTSAPGGSSAAGRGPGAATSSGPVGRPASAAPMPAPASPSA